MQARRFLFLSLHAIGLIVLAAITLRAAPGSATENAHRAQIEMRSSSPMLRAVSILPSPAYPGDTLTCHAEITESGADNVTLRYTWYLNGEELPGHGQTITGDFVFGDEIKCAVTPSEGQTGWQPLSCSMSISCPCQRETQIVAIDPGATLADPVIRRTDDKSGERSSGREPIVGIADPAAVYCADLSYEYRIVDTPAGQRGICVFPDGEQCDAWAFLQGKCGQGWSYCARQGHQVVTKTDGRNPFSQDYAVCVSREGVELGSVTELTMLAEKATGHCVDSSPESTSRGSTPADDHLAADAGSPQSLPSSFDWRNHDGIDWMTSVRDQGTCGSCWAFAAIGSAEAMFNVQMLNPGFDVDLSEEYIVSDCLISSPARSDHCCGGSTLDALCYMAYGGIPDEGCLPYTSGQDCDCPDLGGGPTCSSNCAYRTLANCSESTCTDRCSDWASRLIFAGSCGTAPPSNYKTALISNGPLAVSLAMDGSFEGGIYRCGDWDTDVSNFYNNHAVALVGYNDTGQYWICKNSWGNTWNGGGYFKVGYGECFIDTPPFGPYPNSQAVYAGPPTFACGSTISQDTKLWAALVDCSSDGIYIGADNITLDCQGATIEGSGSPGSVGIDLSERSNVTIKNCRIVGFETGIRMNGGGSNVICDTTVAEHESYGMELHSSTGNSVYGNTIANNQLDGVNLVGSGGNTFHGNSFSGNVRNNAFEDAASTGNIWNLPDAGNYWDDCADNPGAPEYYEIHGPGDGIDWEPDCPTVTVSQLAPHGWSMISVPLAPVDPDPAVVFAGIPISGNLHRYDHEQQKYVTYYDFSPTEFGPVKRGDGFWLSCLDPEGCQVQYEAYPTDGGLQIELLTSGWYMVGARDQDIYFGEVLVSNGLETRPFAEAADVWIQDPFIGYDNAGSQYFSAGLKDIDQDDYLRAWHGYWAYAFEEDLHLILP